MPPTPNAYSCRPMHLDLDKTKGLTVHWEDGSTSFYTILYLRRNSPSADSRVLREQIAKNPLTVLPASKTPNATLTAVNAQLVGNYAIRIVFSDGHDTGIYSWDYLKKIDPTHARPNDSH